jgi:hypothetical protein
VVEVRLRQCANFKGMSELWEHVSKFYCGFCEKRESLGIPIALEEINYGNMSKVAAFNMTFHLNENTQ